MTLTEDQIIEKLAAKADERGIDFGTVDPGYLANFIQLTCVCAFADEALANTMFEKFLDTCKDHPAPVCVRDNEALQIFLGMVGVDGIPIGVIESWTDDDVRQVEDWAASVHLEAGDHDDIDVPPVPEVLKAYRA
jgi:hypothetical protein